MKPARTLSRRRWLAGALAAPALTQASAKANGAEPRLGFALGSGALHGWAHIGIVRACARLGLRPHAIAGCSAGAAVGALWAAGLGATEITRIARTLEWEAGGLLGWLLPWRSRNDQLRETIDRAVGGRNIEQLPMRFSAVASDLEDGEPVILDAGKLSLAVAASCAVPLWYEPVTVGGHRLTDGSLTAPVPVDAARMLGADRVVAVDVAYRPYEEALVSRADHAFQAMHILTNALAREQTRRADHLIKLDLHHLMHKGLDVDALIDAGDAALTRLAPELQRR